MKAEMSVMKGKEYSERRVKAYELVARLLNNLTYAMAWLSKGRTVELVVDHPELKGVTPEMLEWWWANMSRPEWYRLWHPRDHVSATWEISPEEDPLRATQLALEKIGGIPSLFRIRVTDPDTIPIERIYDNAAAGCILDRRDKPIIWVVHEYESTTDGCRMRSTFLIPEKAPKAFQDQLRRHNLEEMSQFPAFLPELFKANN